MYCALEWAPVYNVHSVFENGHIHVHVEMVCVTHVHVEMVCM